MDLDKILGELKQDQARLDEAIGVVERLVQYHGSPSAAFPVVGVKVRRRLGRPPGSKNKPKVLAV